jgi:hypothetical protein
MKAKQVSYFNIGPTRPADYLGTESVLQEQDQKNDLIIKISDMKEKISPNVRKIVDKPSSRKISRVSDTSIIRMDKTNPLNIKWMKAVDENVDARVKKYKKQTRFKELRIRLMKMLRNDKFFLIGGAIAASCNGAIWPIYGILLADAIGTLAEPNMEDVRIGGLNVAMMFLALAFIAAIILWMQK